MKGRTSMIKEPAFESLLGSLPDLAGFDRPGGECIERLGEDWQI